MDNGKTCPKCNEEIQEGWLYCPRCGSLTKTVEDLIREEVRKAEIRVLNLTFQLYADKDLREAAYMFSQLDEKQRFVVRSAINKLQKGVPQKQVMAEAKAEIDKLKDENS